MATNKTHATALPLSHYLDAIEDPARKADCEALVKLMQKTTQQPAALWGNGNPANISSHMVGFGQYHYKYASGTEGDSFCAGFANRKTDITIYISAGFEAVPELMAQLGKHKASKVCIYIKKLADIDQEVLAKLIAHSMRHLKRIYS